MDGNWDVSPDTAESIDVTNSAEDWLTVSVGPMTGELIGLKLEVYDLLAMYGDATDRRDEQLMRRVFCADATFSYGPSRYDGIEDLVAARRALNDKFRRLHHWVAMPLVETTPDGVIRSMALFQNQHFMHSGNRYTVWGRYLDQIVREADGLLRIKSRRVVMHDYVGTDNQYVMLDEQ